MALAMAACSPAQKTEPPRDFSTEQAPTSEAATTPPPTDPVVVDAPPAPTTTTSPEPAPAEPSPSARLGPNTTAVPVPSPPVTTAPPVDYRATSMASWYGYELAGNSTASGEVFNPEDLTFAHKTMAFGTVVRFCANGGCVLARCNDRGPFVAGRSFDLSLAAFRSIAPLGAGVIEVAWEVVG